MSDVPIVRGFQAVEELLRDRERFDEYILETPMPLSVRLDAKTEAAVKRLARRHGRTRSAVVREAIATFEHQHGDHRLSDAAPWARMAHLIGVADSGGGRLSEKTGERFATLVRAKARARRSR